jgi:hypothetical protein
VNLAVVTIDNIIRLMFLGLGILVYCVRPVIRFGAIKVDKNTSTFLELIRINTASTCLCVVNESTTVISVVLMRCF